MKKERPADQRERLQKQEHQKRPVGNATDAFNRARGGVSNSAGMSAKELGGTILFFILVLLGIGIYQYFF